MGNTPSLGSTPEARRAAKAKLSEPKTRSRSISDLGNVELDMFGKKWTDYVGGSGRRKFHRNVHRLKLANNNTKRVRSLKRRTLKIRR